MKRSINNRCLRLLLLFGIVLTPVIPLGHGSSFSITPSTQNMEGNGYAQIFLWWFGNNGIPTPLVYWGDGTSSYGVCQQYQNGYCVVWVADHYYPLNGQAEFVGVSDSVNFVVYGPIVSGGSGGGGGGGGRYRST